MCVFSLSCEGDFGTLARTTRGRLPKGKSVGKRLMGLLVIVLAVGFVVVVGFGVMVVMARVVVVVLSLAVVVLLFCIGERLRRTLNGYPLREFTGSFAGFSQVDSLALTLGGAVQSEDRAPYRSYPFGKSQLD